MNTNATSYNARKDFEKECLPLINELRRKCYLYHIPLYYTACIENDDSDSVYISDAVMPNSSGIILHEDRLRKHLLIDVGFDVLPPTAASVVVDMDSSPDDYDIE